MPDDMRHHADETDQFLAGQREARISALERAGELMSEKLDRIQADVTEIKVSLGGLKQIVEEHKICQGRLAKLETTAATGKGILLAIGGTGGVIGAIVGAVVTWFLHNIKH